MDDQLEAISRLLSPCGDGVPQGIEGAVAVISRMLPSSGATSGPHHRLQLTVEDFAQHVHDDWRVGKQQCDNGFLLFASKEDRQFAISMVSATMPHAPHCCVKSTTCHACNSGGMGAFMVLCLLRSVKQTDRSSGVTFPSEARDEAYGS